MSLPFTHPIGNCSLFLLPVEIDQVKQFLHSYKGFQISHIYNTFFKEPDLSGYVAPYIHRIPEVTYLIILSCELFKLL